MGADMRRHLTFDCDGSVLIGTLDQGPADAGLLIVSGGNEIRMGAHRGMAMLAQDLATMGFPVFRFDRRGIGDSEGENGGFESSRDDILAAVSAFRAACPKIKNIVAFGNCDAATALWLHQPLPFDALVLANPWLVEASANRPAPAAARSYYVNRVRDLRAWAGLLSGTVNLPKMFRSLSRATQRDRTSSLAERVADMLERFPVETNILLAERDGTAVAFKAQWEGTLFDTYRPRISVTALASSSHSFSNDADYQILRNTLLRALTS
jgi:exosortase A-associated hydrolase 1